MVGILSSPEIRDKCNTQASLLLLLDFAVYFLLDAWPFVTTNSGRFHPDTGTPARIRLVCLTIAGILVPLLSPRPFRPVRVDVRKLLYYEVFGTEDMVQEEPIPASVAPILSRLTYAFMDGIVFHAWKAPHVGIDELPPLPIDQEAEVLRSKTFRVSSLPVSS